MKLDLEVQKLMQFFVSGKPHPQTRPRMNKKTGHVYSNANKNLVMWKNSLKKSMSAASMDPACFGVEGAVCVDMVFYLPIKDKKRHGQICHTKPDKDNLEKAVLDIMEECGIFKVGDSQVGVGEVIKLWCCYGDEGVFIKVGRVRPKKNPAPCRVDSLDWLA